MMTDSMTIQYPSPLGPLLLSGDDRGLTGVAFGLSCEENAQAPEKAKGPLADAVRWLNDYFAGRDPGAIPPVQPAGTSFQRAVWALLADIPYGSTTTYGTLAAQLEKQLGRRMSPQAVGGAVGRNPVAILIPCHRVLGADGGLTGYAGGMEKKEALLRLEGVTGYRKAKER